MDNKEINEFIKRSRAQGASDAEIRTSLLSAGWDPQTVNDSFAIVAPGKSIGSNPGGTPVSLRAEVTPEKPIVSNMVASPLSSNSQAASQGMVLPEVKTSPPADSGVELPKGSRVKRWVKIILLILLFLSLVASAAGYWVFGAGKSLFKYNYLDVIWGEFIERAGDKLAEQEMRVSYSDSGDFKFVPSRIGETVISNIVPKESPEYADMMDQIKDLDADYSFDIKNMLLNFGLGGYYDVRDINAPKLDGFMETKIRNNDTDIELNTYLKLLDASGYFKIFLNPTLVDKLKAQYPEVAPAITMLNNTWLKFSKESEIYEAFIAGFKEGLVPTADSELSKEEEKLKKQAARLQDIYKANRVFDIQNFKGLSKINNAWTLHYSLNLRKDKLKTIYLETVKILGEESVNKSEFKDFLTAYEQVLDAWLKAWEIKNLELWVGVKDKRFYKLDFASNTPSIIGAANLLISDFESGKFGILNVVVNDSLSSARSKARNAKRVVDMRQLASGLELFYNDFGGYPEAQNGKPLYLDGHSGMENEGSIYVGIIPQAPTPADGSCTDFYNNYWYTPVGTATIVPDPRNRGKSMKVYQDYKYSFCLGDVVGGYGPGNMYLTPSGIMPLTDCPATRECALKEPRTTMSTEEMTKKVLDAFADYMSRIPFTAEFNFNSVAKSFNTERPIEEPKDFKDIDEMYKDLENQLEGNQL